MRVQESPSRERQVRLSMAQLSLSLTYSVSSHLPAQPPVSLTEDSWQILNWTRLGNTWGRGHGGGRHIREEEKG